MQTGYPNGTFNYAYNPQGTSAPMTSPTSYYAANPYTEASTTQMPLESYSALRRPSTSRKANPDSLISLDAPTQPRRYVTPSATSRKDVPAFFAKMRNHTPPSEEEEDELTEEPPASNATDQEKIEWKRRQNTLAARRSRKRKLLNLQRLEETVERLTREREIWKTRALTLRQLLTSHGIICPEFRD